MTAHENYKLVSYLILLDVQYLIIFFFFNFNLFVRTIFMFSGRASLLGCFGVTTGMEELSISPIQGLILEDLKSFLSSASPVGQLMGCGEKRSMQKL